MNLDRSLEDGLAAAGQDAFLEHYRIQDEVAQDRLRRQIETLDLALLADLNHGRRLAQPIRGEAVAPRFVPLEERGPKTKHGKAGTKALRAGKVAFVLVAGGQATRLKWEGPKGTFPIGPGSDRSLFRIHVERVLKAGQRFGVLPPLAVTTSPGTDVAVRAFFELKDCFGFERGRLCFACQEALPTLDENGRLMLTTPDRIFTSPDGHGGALRAVRQSGILKEWRAAGVTTICTFQVDNPLALAVDPDFIGRVLLDDPPVATKVVMKTDPEERVGIVVLVDGKPAVLEYSELAEKQATARDANGDLRYRLGSIASHAFSLDFLDAGLAEELPLHTAARGIPCLDEAGALVWRTGTKFERFLFDVFRAADGITAVEVAREHEFAPLKNIEGEDSPQTVRAALDREYRRWYSEAGQDAPSKERFDVSPLIAEGPEDLRQ